MDSTHWPLRLRVGDPKRTQTIGSLHSFLVLVLNENGIARQPQAVLGSTAHHAPQLPSPSQHYSPTTSRSHESCCGPSPATLAHTEPATEGSTDDARREKQVASP
jgi:hypothetical protein